MAEQREEEPPVLVRGYIAVWVSRRLLPVGLNLGELPACSSESAQCGEELSAGRDLALKRSGLPVSTQVWRWIPPAK
jgi:hypothetical protein